MYSKRVNDSMLKKLFYRFKNIFNAFFDDDCYSKASALSFYTLMSIVPVLAVAFGIAKGFGFDDALEKQIMELLYQQKEFAEKLIRFAKATLEQAHGSLIAGSGVVLLLWSAMGLLGNFERALNTIWKVKTLRPFGKRITDYLPVLILTPIFIVSTSSLTFLVVTKVVQFSVDTGFYQEVKPFIYTFYYGLLICLSWLLFSFLYIYIPNRKVPWGPSIFAALFAALFFQATQWGYINLQIYLTSYNAIYGSFAAIPLFLLWLQISWVIVLTGAELAKSQEMIKEGDHLNGEEKITLQIFAKKPGEEGEILGAIKVDLDKFKN